MDKIEILGTNVDLLSIQSLHDRLKQLIDTGKKGTVDYLNIYSANLAFENKWFSLFLNSCDIILCDGKGIQFAALISGKKVPMQIAYNRWLWDFFKFCEKEHYSIFFLGSKPEIVQQALDQISEKGYKIRMSGHHGYFDKSHDGSKEVLDQIDKFAPDFLLVGFGMPLQEKWVSENLERINSKVTILGGAYLDWISGSVAQTPKIVSNFGLEWAYRLILEPQRLYKRYIFGIPKFFVRLLRHA